MPELRRLSRHAVAAVVLLACAGGAAAALLHQSRDVDASITSVALNGKVHARVVCTPAGISLLSSASVWPAQLSPKVTSPMWNRCAFGGNFGWIRRVMK